VWAQYESERKKPAVTKLSRRGYVAGKVAPGVKKQKAAPAPEPAAAAEVAEPAGVVDDDATAEEAADAAIEESESQ
jgi:hypothetical protein